MPRRWTSIRRNDKIQPSTFHVPEPHQLKGFDFAFGSKPKALRGESVSRNFNESAMSPLEPTSQVTQDAPQTIYRLQPTSKSVSQLPTYAYGGPKSGRSVHKKRWRKISEVLRPGSNTHVNTSEEKSLCPNVEEKKLGLHIARTPWRNPTSPPSLQDESAEQRNEPQNIDLILQDNGHTSSDSHQSEVLLASQHLVLTPQLEVNIPLTPLERFSVMFRDIHGGLLSDSPPDSKINNDGDPSANVGKDNSKRLGILTLRRRATSPTSSQFDISVVNAVTQAHRSSKYSLFPTPQTPTKPSFATSSPVPNRRRSLTAPSELRSLQVEAANTKARGIQRPQTSSQFSTALSALTQSKAHQDKKHLRNDSENEIFFDIKSFRGSNGVDGSQFEMTRPPSSAIQLARSKSNARKVVQKHIVHEDIRHHNEIKIQESCGYTRDASAQIDETIAMVEALTSPASRVSSADNTRSGDRIYQEDGRHSVGASSKEGSFKEIFKKDLEKNLASHDPAHELNLLVGNESETLAQTEEEKVLFHKTDVAISDLGSSEQTTGTFSNLRAPWSPDLPFIDEPLYMTDVENETNLGKSSDSAAIQTTFAPISRYAPDQIKEDLLRKKSIRPVPPIRAGRSNTETNINGNFTRRDHSRPYNTKRASSLPTTLIQIPAINHGPEGSAIVNPPSLNEDRTAMSTITVCASPAAEVSIARKVSVVRKQNAKIVEPKNNSKAQISTKSNGLERVASLQQSREVDMKRIAHIDKRLPIVQEVQQRHKPGSSIDIELDSATIRSSSSSPRDVNVHHKSKFEKALPPIPV